LSRTQFGHTARVADPRGVVLLQNLENMETAERIALAKEVMFDMEKQRRQREEAT